eukprot:2354756-Amphidinium_carterae.2
MTSIAKWRLVHPLCQQCYAIKLPCTGQMNVTLVVKTLTGNTLLIDVSRDDTVGVVKDVFTGACLDDLACSSLLMWSNSVVSAKQLPLSAATCNRTELRRWNKCQLQVR